MPLRYPFPGRTRSLCLALFTWTAVLNPLWALPPEPVAFSVPAGYQLDPVSVTLTCPTPGAVIRYTLDGSDPTLPGSTPQTYSTPLRITDNRVLRAVATVSGEAPSLVQTATYIFPDQVSSQSANQSDRGLPAEWITLNGLPYQPQHGTNGPGNEYYTRPAVYGVSSTGAAAHPNFAEDIQTLPVVSLALDPDDLFSRTTGIYANSSQSWERAASVEWIEPTGLRRFQTGCNARIMGDLSRREDVNVKHGFLLKFQEAYGANKVPNTIFPESNAPRLDRLALRAAWGDSWLRDGAEQAVLIRDLFANRSYHAMGHRAAAGQMVHLYLNGLYWGVYQASERPGEDFLEDRTDIPEAEWDVVKGIIYDDNWYLPSSMVLGAGRNGELVSGTITAWDRMFAQAAAISGTASNAQMDNLGQHLDLDAFCDYMLLNLYATNWDWPQKNWYAAARPSKTGGTLPVEKWFFIPWDTEAAFYYDFLNVDPATFTGRMMKGPALLWKPLWQNPEFALRFADRVQKHYFDEGALSAPQATARFATLQDSLARSIAGESARWGYWNNPGSPYTVEGDWWPAANRLESEYFPRRTASSLQQFRDLGLYPAVAAPEIRTPATVLLPGSAIQLAAPAGEIHFTTDGSDPRLRGGALNPQARLYSRQITNTELLARGSVWKYLDQGADAGTAWRAPDFDDTDWAAGPARLGYGGDGETTVISFGGDSANRHITTYFRRALTLENAAAFQEYTLQLVRDDGAIVYVNGVEVVRDGLPSGPVDYRTPAALASGASETTAYSFAIPAGVFQNGRNVIAVEVHQQSGTSSDLGFDLALSGSQIQEQGSPILQRSATVKTRVRSGSTWSALTERSYTVAPVLAAAAVYPVEIHPVPLPPSAAESALNAGWDANDFEFIELLNPGSSPVVLEGARLDGGIHKTFKPGTPDLAPGGRLVLAANLAAFAARYGFPADGSYDDRLAAAGETFRMLDAHGNEVFACTYDLAWRGGTEGASLTLRADSLSAWQDGTAWRASVADQGTPGEPETDPAIEPEPDPVLDTLGAYTAVDATHIQVAWFAEESIRLAQFPWIVHPTHGWLHVVGTPDNLWVYDWSSGSWWWTNRTYYPWIYDWKHTGWLRFLFRTPEGRWYYDPATGENLVQP